MAMFAELHILRKIIHFLVSLSLGVFTTFFIASVSNQKQERELKDEVEIEAMYITAFLKKTFPDIADRPLADAFINYIREMKRDKWIVKEKGSDHLHSIEHHNDGYLHPGPPGDKYMLTFKIGERNLDIFLSQQYFYVRVTELDPMEVVPGIIIMVISMGAQIAYSDKKHYADEMKIQYEQETSALNEMLKKQEALALVGRMAATLAHEFKTPIATISNLIQVLPSRSSDGAFIQRFVFLTKKELSRAQQLTDNLLIYGKDISDLHGEWIDLRKLINELAVSVRPLSVVCANASFFGDRFYIGVLFENILKNSLNARADKVFISVSPEGDGSTGICCEDNGTGFPKEADLAQLTEPFVTNRSRGAGLGLYLVGKIATAHRGAVVLEARETGALVKLTFPAERIKAYG